MVVSPPKPILCPFQEGSFGRKMTTKEVNVYRNRRAVLFTGELVEISGCYAGKDRRKWKRGTILRLYKEKALVKWKQPGKGGETQHGWAYSKIIPIGKNRPSSPTHHSSSGSVVYHEHIPARSIIPQPVGPKVLSSFSAMVCAPPKNL